MTYLLKKVEHDELKPRSFIEQKKDGLKLRNPNKIDYILKIEKLWEEYAFTRSKQTQLRLLKTLNFTIRQKAYSWEKKWKKKRLSHADFESVFFEEAWKLCDAYNHYGDFYFYETLLLAWKRRGTDITRKLQTKKGGFEAELLPLLPETAEYLSNDIDIEEDVVNRHLVTQILNNESLTGKERHLLREIYKNPDASYLELAETIGLNHHEQVRRMLRQIKKKLSYILL